MSFDVINPYEILNLSPNASQRDVHSAFMRLVISQDRIIRAKVCLAYDTQCNKEKYIKEGNYYRIKNKDCFYFALMGDFESLKRKIEENKNNLYQKDGLKRSLLYLTCRNGFFNVSEYLIKKGININEVEKDGNTALHAAAFYGQENVIQLLIENGIDIDIRNRYWSRAAEEAKTQKIRELILDSKKDLILELFHNLYNKGLVSNILPIKKNGEIIAQKLICSQKILPYNWSYIYKNWIPAWYGTKLLFLESIIKNGLRPSGTKLPYGTSINPLTTTTVSEIKNWAMNIIVSPSLFYASNVVYSERFNCMKDSSSSPKRYACLVEVRLRPDCFSKHNSTVINYSNLPGEPDTVEYRVEVKSDSDLIYRIDSEKNVVVTSITFVLVKFLENVSKYSEGNIMINSKEEQMLLEI